MTDLYVPGRKYRFYNIIAKGEIIGFQWVIITLGSHPCAYVAVDPKHPYYRMDYDTMFEKEIYLECHGGVTYTEHDKDTRSWGTQDLWWIGWDYAHAGDHDANYDQPYENHKWTLKEIKKDVLSMIAQLEEVKTNDQDQKGYFRKTLREGRAQAILREQETQGLFHPRRHADVRVFLGV